MSRTKIIVFCLCFACLNLHAQSFYALAQLNWFDAYTKVSLDEEKAHLDNFAYYLRKNPNWTGYIGYFVGNGEKGKKIKQRVLKAKKYLVSEYNLPESRIVIIYGGKSAETKFILQPKLYSELPPKF
jgi:hypothetical protein